MVVMMGLRIFPGWSYVVRPDGEFRLPDPDAYFHFRQSIYTVQHFPRLLRWDDLSFYPSVLRNDAAGLYDLTLAGLAKLVALFGLDPLRALWWVCLWFPPLCATAILPLVYVLVRRQATLAIALMMALWYVLLPGLTLSHMTLGICDHHVVEMLTGVLCVLLLGRLVKRERERPTAWWRPAWGTALPLVLLQFTWLGGPLFAAIFGLAGLGQLAADVLAGSGAGASVRAGIRYWLAFLLLTGGAGVLCPGLVLVLNLWHATVVGAVGAIGGLAVTGWFFATPWLRLRPAPRLALGVGMLAVLAYLLITFSETVSTLVVVGLSHKPLTVAENQVVTARFYFGVTGLAGLLGLLAPLAGIVTGVWRRPAWWIAVLPSVFFIAIWWRSYDYGYEGALHAILLTGYFFGALATDLAPDRARRRGRYLRPALAVCTVAVVLCRWPAGWTAPWVLTGKWYETLSGLPSDGWVDAMRWLRTATPPPPPLPAVPVPGQLPRGRVGVLTDWDDGNFVNTLARRPATSSRFPTAERTAPLFLTTEAAVRAAILDDSTVAAAVRYVALAPETISQSFNTHRETIGLPAQDFLGQTTFVDGLGRVVEVPTLGRGYDDAFAVRLLVGDGAGFAHFRLVFESRQECFLRFIYYPRLNAIVPQASLLRTAALRALAVQDTALGLWPENGGSAYLGHVLAAVKIFEQVPGARLEGPAPPGATVVVTIPLRLHTSGRTWQYRQSRRAGTDGRFALTVPYATELAPGTDLDPVGPALLGLDGPPARPETLVISEAAVQHGERVLCQGWPARGEVR